jgi:hypothetical protein
MKGMLKGVAVLAFAAVVGATTVEAQGVKFGVAGTGLFSLESGGGSEFGAMALVGFGGKAGSPIGFRVDGTFLKKNGVTSIPVTGDVIYTFATAASSMFHPYVLAGGGIIHASGGGESVTKPMAKAGVGADYMMGKVMLFGEATFDLFFYGGNSGGTQKALQTNLGVKFGG